jgi:hypothetical protein
MPPSYSCFLKYYQRLPDSRKALRALYRVLVPGSVCAASFWQLPGYFKFAAAAIGALPVGAPPAPTGGSFVNKQPGDAWDDGGFVELVLAECGFEGAHAQLVAHATGHASADAFVDVRGDQQLNVVQCFRQYLYRYMFITASLLRLSKSVCSSSPNADALSSSRPS